MEDFVVSRNKIGLGQTEKNANLIEQRNEQINRIIDLMRVGGMDANLRTLNLPLALDQFQFQLSRRGFVSRTRLMLGMIVGSVQDFLHRGDRLFQRQLDVEGLVLEPGGCQGGEEVPGPDKMRGQPEIFRFNGCLLKLVKLFYFGNVILAVL